MPANKNAIIRHRIIDQCINSKRHKFPSLEYLADRCSEMLGTEISTSTIEKDLALMKKDIPVGYNAPIVYSKQEKGYAYSEVGFSIAELNLQEQEWNALHFAAQLLFQYKDVPVFTDFKQAIERIRSGDLSLCYGNINQRTTPRLLY
jgi:predicted DNA-binding transcriptional regulator YafY